MKRHRRMHTVPVRPKYEAKGHGNRVAISISAVGFERLQRAAALAGMTMGAFVDERINLFLNRKGQP